jgi:3-deoxy-7-phosphoheptulonate synthase
MTHHLSPLAAARAEIDVIDDLILSLIESRLSAARAVAAAKQADGLLKLRPRRQAEVIARLQRRASTARAGAVHAIWRELMSHSLEAQAPTRLLLAPGTDQALAAVREAFGSAPAVEHVASAAEALGRAVREEAVAILPALPACLPEGLRTIRHLHGDDGASLAIAIGRIAAEEALDVTAPARGWSPSSWRGRKPAQQPLYPDATALAAAEAELAAAAPVIAVSRAAALRAEVARAAEGRGFLLQAGDCAESFAGFSAERVKDDRALLLALGTALGGNVVHVARAAGQFAKPRSSPLETRGSATLPSYRGDAVNGAGFSHAERLPDPQRLVQAHRQSRATSALLEALDQADRLSGATQRVWTSHEALLLPYEEALTRRDPAAGLWWNLAGDMVWIGDRTRDLGGAHVEYAGGIANTVGLKCGPTITADDLLRLAERLDSANAPGRLVLIGRFGAEAIAEHLPRLMRATRAAGLSALWVCDPMHGNGRTVGGHKTRYLSDIAGEAEAFFDIADSEGVHAGGLHLETTGSAVTECVGAGVSEGDLGRRYETLCDPRLNPGQALALATRVARGRQRPEPRISSAA